MKKGKKILCVILAAAVVCIACAALWYFQPKTFLKGIGAEEITKITVFDGTNGKFFTVTKADEIEKIVTSIQSVRLKKDRISTGYSGFSFSMTFYCDDDIDLDTFIMNSDDTIRDDPFFYVCSGGLGYDYLKELEKEYAMW